MKNFSLLIKPASFNCNLHCRYCFYLSKEDLFGSGKHRMSLETFERMVRKYAECDLPEYSFAFQGGEPTLMGLDFYRQTVQIQQQYLSGRKVNNCLQTNGTMLDQNFAKFLRSQDFLVGISLDGPRCIHNIHRQSATGQGSYDMVERGVTVLKKNKVRYNTLTLVSSANVECAAQVYKYLKRIGSDFHQYIECVEHNPQGKLREYALQPGQWGNFLCEIFDLWYPKDVRKISIRLFDSIINELIYGVPTICSMGTDCRNYFVVEYDGSVYPCDFFVRDSLRLGNVNDPDFSFRKILYSHGYQDFGLQKISVHPDCMECDVKRYCQGDCPKNRIFNGKSSLCEDWKVFYHHTLDKFTRLAHQVIDEMRT